MKLGDSKSPHNIALKPANKAPEPGMIIEGSVRHSKEPRGKLIPKVTNAASGIFLLIYALPAMPRGPEPPVT